MNLNGSKLRHTNNELPNLNVKIFTFRSLSLQFEVVEKGVKN